MIAFEHQFTDVADHPLLYPVIEVALILVIAELSYRFIEQPVAKFDYRQLRTWFAQLVDRRVADRTPRIVVAIAAVILPSAVSGWCRHHTRRRFTSRNWPSG